MRLQSFLCESNVVTDALNKIKNFSHTRLKDFLFKQFEQFMEIVQQEGMEKQVVNVINKHYKTNYRSLEDMTRQRIRESEEKQMNEDLAHWWEAVKTEAFPTLAFYPALTVWLEIDKLLKGQDVSVRIIIVYALFWVLLISGKYIKSWMEWKKSNPEAYEKEQSVGKGGIV